ncbi:MAG: hypothetical protein LCH90_17880 [Proteobacteria bacterium]|nr:hypothetical protein [Pseudomonadota bacterium]
MSSDERKLDLTGWIERIRHCEMPVFGRTVAALRALMDDEMDDAVTDDDDLGDVETMEPGLGGGALDFNAQKEAFEKEFIMKALKMFKGRINQTALHANIPKKTLLRKIEKYGIVAKDFSQQ